MWQQYFNDPLRSLVEILLLATIFYQIYRTFRSTRGAQILVGLGTLLLILILVSRVFRLEVIQWILYQATTIIAIALIVLFQPELRTGLARVGSNKFFSVFNKRRQTFVTDFCETVLNLSKKRVGALFAFQREISLKEQLDTGVQLDAQFSSELTMSIFFPKSPLHDGGIIIVDDRINGAACVFPVTEKEMQDRSTGLRHRAAIGLTERTDAICVVVSEETGGIAICHNGNLIRNMAEKEFRDKLLQLLSGLDPNENTPNSKLDSKTPISASSDRGMAPH